MIAKLSRTWPRVVLLALCALAGLPACAYLVGSWSGPTSTALLRDRITFSHKKHVIDEGVDCGDCHGEVKASTSLEGHRFLPREKTCLECHDKEDNCGMCHANANVPTTFPDTRMPGLLFSHKAHADRKTADGKGGCDVCHADVKTATKVSMDKRPPMFEACGQCHKPDFGAEDCSRCHATGSLQGVHSPQIFDHGGDWLKRHGTAAKGGENVCGHCHKPDTCADCHSRTNVAVRPSQFKLDKVGSEFHHRGDFLPRHPIEARLDSKSCQGCHEPSHCTDCHSRMGVSSQTPGVGSPHPKQWLNRGGSSFHGDEVRRDPMSCVACHDRGVQSNCVTCHKIGAPGGNPHPPGFDSNQEKLRAPACTPCHR